MDEKIETGPGRDLSPDWPPKHGAKYIGDGVYIKQGRWAGELILYTDNGYTEENHIYLDEQVTDSLLEYLRRRKGI